MFKKILAMMLALITVASLAACSIGIGNEETTAADSTVETEFTLPEFDFDGHEFNILSVGRGSVNTNDFLAEDVSSTVLSNAINNRNKAVEDLYDIKIVTKQQDTTANQQSPQAYRELVREAMSGDYNYDMCVIPGYDVSQLAYENYLTDLKALPYFDGENTWYDQKANETFDFCGSLFFTTGDFGISMMDQTYCIAFNKKLAAQFELEDVYELVNEKQWTIDKIAELSKLVTTDSDGDGLTDIYGTLYWVDSVYGAVNAAGVRMVTLNTDTQSYELSIQGEVTSNMLEKFYNLVMDNDVSLKYQHNSKNKEYVPIFSGDQALFFLTTIGKLGEFRDMDTDYGILPYFLYDEGQEEYHNTVAPFYMNYMCVPYWIEDYQRTSAIIEAIGMYSEQIIIPAYYEKTLYGQYTRDEESTEMLDLIFATRAYDLGYCYQPANLNKNLIYMLNEGTFDWSTRYASLEIAAQTQLDTISKAYREAIAANNAE